MVEYLRNYFNCESQVRLKLAHVLIEAEHRPSQALKVLSKLNAALVSEKEAAQLERLRARAEQLQAKSPLEVADKDW